MNCPICYKRHKVVAAVSETLGRCERCGTDIKKFGSYQELQHDRKQVKRPELPDKVMTTEEIKHKRLREMTRKPKRYKVGGEWV